MFSTGKQKIILRTHLNNKPDVIRLHSHGVKDNKNIKIVGYYCYSKNSSNAINGGTAILIKHNIKHTINDDFISNMLEITIDTPVGRLSLATAYLPPRRPYLPYPDFH